MNAPKKLALFGGSFDPIHNGHLDLARSARQIVDFDRVLFIPCRQSPHKSKAPRATDKQRCEMLTLATKYIEWAELSRIEIDRNSPSFSWQTSLYFARQFPQCELFWILGADQWKKIHTWAEPERLRKRLTFIVATRDDEIVEPRPGWRHLSIPLNNPANATAIRAGEGESDWLTAPIAKYIKANQVYS